MIAAAQAAATPNASYDIRMQFLPDAAIGRALDRRMRRELGSSVRHIVEQWDSPHALPTGLAQALGVIEGDAAIAPVTFAAYFRAAEALISGDDKAALPHLSYLVETARPVEPLSFAAADASSPLGTSFDYFERCFDTDRKIKFDMYPAGDEAATLGKAGIAAGHDLLRAGAPEIAGEFEAIVQQFVLVESPKSERRFGGGSSYQLWGALALNVGEPKTLLVMAESLAHEATHSFLFGHTTMEPLAFNPDEQLFKSPLRADPRPMDGIYHATFVSARMFYLLDQLLSWGGLAPDDQRLANAAREKAAEKFRDGRTVVDDFGDLSLVGRTLLDAASAHLGKV